MSSTTPTRSTGSNRSVSERSSVVLPAPVSPATSTFARAATMRARNAATSGLMPPSVTQSRPWRPPGARSSRRRLNLRIERYGPPTGGMTALTRRAVGHPGVDDRVGDGQLASGERRDPLGDLDELALGAEEHARPLEAPGPLGEDRVGGVDEDVADLGIVDERLQRSEPA